MALPDLPRWLFPVLVITIIVLTYLGILGVA